MDALPAEPISPELALVDPSLRLAAIAALPPLETRDFLRQPRQSSPSALVPEQRPPSLPLAAAGYTAVAIVRVLLFDLSLVAALMLVIIVVTLLR